MSAAFLLVFELVDFLGGRLLSSFGKVATALVRAVVCSTHLSCAVGLAMGADICEVYDRVEENGISDPTCTSPGGASRHAGPRDPQTEGLGNTEMLIHEWRRHSTSKPSCLSRGHQQPSSELSLQSRENFI